MRVFICWTHLSGYMAACWRALSACPGIELSVMCVQSVDATIGFQADLLHGLNAHVLSPEQWNDYSVVRSMVLAAKPDVVLISGWGHRPYVRLARDAALSHARFVMMTDTPRRDTWRQRLGRLKIRSLLRRVDRMMVAGERAWQLGRLLGVPEEKLRRGVYGFDRKQFGAVLPRRPPDGRDWPRAFLFVGRYIAVKGIEVLLDAYARYRAMPRADSTQDPWTLTCCGKGPLASLISGQPGVRDLGFISPPALPDVLLQHGALILPSLYEPWGVALAEALATGLPAICTEACGASVELLRPLYNGLLCATGDAGALAEAMYWIEAHQAKLPEMGRRGAELAAAFDAEVWALRCAEMFKEICPAAALDAAWIASVNTEAASVAAKSNG